MKNNLKKLRIGICLLLAFILWTVAVRFLDVQAIGPKNSSVGFATLNGVFHRLTGVHLTLYTITDWLGLLPLAIVAGFGILGLCQWIHRRKLRLVDRDILISGGFYLVVAAVFLLFEEVVINYRPILIEGRQEASYPSSTTLLTLCVMPVARKLLNRRIRPATYRRIVTVLTVCFTAFMVIGRLISGVHWLTDILGGILLSFGLVLTHSAVDQAQKSF